MIFVERCSYLVACEADLERGLFAAHFHGFDCCLISYAIIGWSLEFAWISIKWQWFSVT